jgi:hypothetical protein
MVLKDLPERNAIKKMAKAQVVVDFQDVEEAEAVAEEASSVEAEAAAEVEEDLEEQDQQPKEKLILMK